MNKQKKHIIFDLDGTLIDSRNEILKTYEAVFSTIIPSVKPDVESLNYGLTLNDVLLGVYGAEKNKLAGAKELFISIYDNSDYSETTLYDGVSENLANLKDKGFGLYIATNKRLSPTILILKAKEINDFFSGLMANEMAPGQTLTKRQMIAALKHEGSFTDGYMVGDSSSDIIAGKEEQLATIAINYGYERADVLAALKPTYCADSFQNLYTFVLNDF